MIDVAKLLVENRRTRTNVENSPWHKTTIVWDSAAYCQLLAAALPLGISVEGYIELLMLAMLEAES